MEIVSWSPADRSFYRDCTRNYAGRFFVRLLIAGLMSFAKDICDNVISFHFIVSFLRVAAFSLIIGDG